MMNKLWNLLMKGLAAVLPIGLTIYLVIWLGTNTEAVLRDLITFVLPGVHYWPGLGLIVGFLLLLGAGLVVNAYVVRWFLGQWDQFPRPYSAGQDGLRRAARPGQVPAVGRQAS